LPTLWGWLVLLVVLALAALIAGRALYPFLAINEPSGGKILVIEGWMDPEGLDQAVKVFRKGRYELAVVTGAPLAEWPQGIYRTAAERAAEYLKSRGLPPAAVAAAPSPWSAQDRTFLSAVMVREWAKRSGIEVQALDVFSLGTHARRSRLLFQKAFGAQVEVGAIAGRHENAGGEAQKARARCSTRRPRTRGSCSSSIRWRPARIRSAGRWRRRARSSSAAPGAWAYAYGRRRPYWRSILAGCIECLSPRSSRARASAGRCNARERCRIGLKALLRRATRLL